MKWRYRITGRVLEAETGRALANLVVRAWDKDLVFDDYLGDCRTDAEGRFEIRFTDEAFRQVFDENPDIYLRLYDPEDARLIHTTADDIRRNASEEEHFEVEIPAVALEG